MKKCIYSVVRLKFLREAIHPEFYVKPPKFLMLATVVKHLHPLQITQTSHRLPVWQPCCSPDWNNWWIEATREREQRGEMSPGCEGPACWEAWVSPSRGWGAPEGRAWLLGRSGGTGACLQLRFLHRSPIYWGSDLYVPPVYTCLRPVPSLGAAGFLCPLELSLKYCQHCTLSILPPIPPWLVLPATQWPLT